MRKLLVKYLSGALPENEKGKLAQWLTSLDNRKRFENLKTLWEVMEDYQNHFSPDVKRAWDRFDYRIQRAKTRRFYLRIATSVAAIILLLFSIGILFRKSENNTITICANTGQTKNIVLPDSSLVCLKQGSSISYTSPFLKRIVNLKGEAFFQVTKIKNSSFRVEGGNTQAVVLGTSFNYRTGNDEIADELYVFTGKVQFSCQTEKSDKVILTKGTKATLIRDKFEKTRFKNHNVLFYKTRKLSFNNSSLQEFVETISSCYQQKIVVKLKDKYLVRLNTEFHNASMEAIMLEFEIITGLKVKHGDGLWSIDKK